MEEIADKFLLILDEAEGWNMMERWAAGKKK
jgi:hypothetical protein